MNKALSAFVASGLVAVCAGAYAQQGENIRLAFNIRAQPLDTALTDFAQATGLQLLVLSEMVHERTAPQISGTLTPEAALTQLLADSGLRYEFVNDRTVTIRTADAAPSGASSRTTASSPEGAAQGAFVAQNSASEEDERAKRTAADDQNVPSSRGIPEVLVKGSKILNMDVKRSRDDAQPYVIFERKAIENSGAATVEELLKQRLTMNTQGETNRQVGGNFGNISQINLRGLGSAQTLILVDGHRMAGLAQSGSPLQPDINGIPLAGIERIEVLPTTASGIYGGSATGGVVNIVMRRDYAGTEAKVTYGDAFDAGGKSRRVDVSGGLSLEEGKTNILLAGSWVDDDDLLADEREFLVRARQTAVDNAGTFDTLTASGVPPLGAVTNIRSSTGANLTLKPVYGGTNLGSPITFLPDGYAGVGASGVSGLIQNAGRYNIDLAPTLHSNGGGQAPLLNKSTVKSLMLTLRRRFTENLQAFIDASGSSNVGDTRVAASGSSFTVNAAAPNNPFTQAIRVSVPIPTVRDISAEVKSNRVVGGAILSLPADWTAEVDHSWNKVTYDNNNDPLALANTATAAIGNGNLNVLRDLTSFPLDLGPYMAQLVGDNASVGDYVLKDTVLRAAGPVLSFAGNTITMAALLERRTETLDPFSQFNGTTGAETFVMERRQTVDSAYLEAQVPLVSRSNARAGLRSLDAQIAVRRDEYTTTGAAESSAVTARNEVSSTDPTFGLRYSPADGLVLRASYGTGFLPPSVAQLVPLPTRTGTLSGVVDPLRNNEAVTTVSIFSGGKAELTPEQSKSWSAGVVLTPAVLRGARLSVDYTSIKKEDNITSFSTPQQIVNSESLFPGVVERAPLAPGETVGKITGLDFGLINIAKAEVEAFDAQIDYRLATEVGNIEMFAVGTWQTHYKTQFTSTSPIVENVGYTSSSPVKFKANFGLTFNRGPWTAGWAGRFLDSYLVINPAVANPNNDRLLLNQGNSGRVPNQQYHDLFAGYRFAGLWLLSSAEMRVGVQNVFNKRPPIDAANGNGYSTFSDPRLASYFVSIKTSF